MNRYSVSGSWAGLQWVVSGFSRDDGTARVRRNRRRKNEWHAEQHVSRKPGSKQGHVFSHFRWMDWYVPAPSKFLNLKEKNLSSISVHQCTMPNKRDLNSAEWGTVRLSRRPIAVIAANGSIETNEEATVHVRDLVGLIRDGAACRGYVASFVAWKALRRSRIFL